MTHQLSKDQCYKRLSQLIASRYAIYHSTENNKGLSICTFGMNNIFPITLYQKFHNMLNTDYINCHKLPIGFIRLFFFAFLFYFFFTFHTYIYNLFKFHEHLSIASSFTSPFVFYSSYSHVLIWLLVLFFFPSIDLKM